jgi:hypothetical protein
VIFDGFDPRLGGADDGVKALAFADVALESLQTTCASRFDGWQYCDNIAERVHRQASPDSETDEETQI